MQLNQTIMRSGQFLGITVRCPVCQSYVIAPWLPAMCPVCKALLAKVLPMAEREAAKHE